MPIDRTTRVFFDAACLIAAAGSATGGSSYLLSLCEQGFLTGSVSDLVLREAARNIRDKLPGPALQRFDHLRTHVPLQMVHVSSQAQQAYAQTVNAKDVHVLAAAMLASAQFLVTLDGPFAREVNRANLFALALTPAEFIRTILPQHPDYDALGR
jgi:predicted nucleic acid-binding protein